MARVREEEHEAFVRKPDVISLYIHTAIRIAQGLIQSPIIGSRCRLR